MVKLTCACLNVKIFTKKSTDLVPLSIAKLGLSPSCKDDFFNHEIAEVHLDLEGVKVEHSSLVSKRQASDWVVHKCASCQVLTHATSSNRILVNLSLKREASIIDSLQQSGDYSALYKVVLHNKNDNQAMKTLEVDTARYESLQQTVGYIQQQLNQFLLDEEAAMQERIRKYEEEQKARYAELESKARRDKNSMISMVLATEEENKKHRLSEDRSHVATADKASEELSSGEVVPTLHKKLAATPVQSSNVQVKRKVAPTSKPHYVHHTQSDPSDDALFDMEDLHGGQEPFYESEEETSDTDDSTDAPSYRPSLSKKAMQYSSSVPISVPTFGRQISGRQLYDVQDEELAEEPGFDMAASIKALAQSVHGDGTEIFGDRPRPRYSHPSEGC